MADNRRVSTRSKQGSITTNQGSGLSGDESLSQLRTGLAKIVAGAILRRRAGVPSRALKAVDGGRQP
jgi:hypothetical protein